MCDDKPCCEHPEKLKGKPSECSPEQIKECHGETTAHPCVSPGHAADKATENE